MPWHRLKGPSARLLDAPHMPAGGLSSPNSSELPSSSAKSIFAPPASRRLEKRWRGYRGQLVSVVRLYRPRSSV
jgi:hypothetical protein